MTRLTISAAVVCLLGAGMAEASPAPRSQQMNPRSGMKLGSRMMNPFKAIGSMFRRQKPVKPATPTLAHQVSDIRRASAKFGRDAQGIITAQANAIQAGIKTTYTNPSGEVTTASKPGHLKALAALVDSSNHASALRLRSGPQLVSDNKARIHGTVVRLGSGRLDKDGLSMQYQEGPVDSKGAFPKGLAPVVWTRTQEGGPATWITEGALAK